MACDVGEKDGVQDVRAEADEQELDAVTDKAEKRQWHPWVFDV
jgi:hypothetical protein